MSAWAPRRFWTSAQAVPATGGYTVTLDNRPVRTPGKAALIVPTRALAEEIAHEWDAQEGVIRPATMPLTRSANSAIDKVAPNLAGVVAEISGYGASDLICYRAEGPRALADRQALAWDPLLDWAATHLGAPLRVTQGVVPVSQPPKSLARLKNHVERLPPFVLTALHDLVALSGSLVIGLRVLHPQADIDALWRASRIDEDWQTACWGVDDEAAAMAAAREDAFRTAARFFDLVAATSQ